MITEHDLAEAIAECEGQRNPTANTCLRLAAFYTIRDKMFPEKQESNFYSMQSKEQKVIEEKAEHQKDESEFKRIAVELSANELINIMDEVMTTLKIISPKLYDGVMRKMTQVS